MANPYPVRIVDETDVERLAGDLTFTDPGNQPGGGLPPQWTTDDVTGGVTGTGDGSVPVLDLTPGVVNGDHQTLEARYSDGSPGLSVGDDSSIELHGRGGGVTSPGGGGVTLEAGSGTGAGLGGTVTIAAGAAGPTAGADGGQLQLRAGDGEGVSGTGGDVTIAPGGADTNGTVQLLDALGAVQVLVSDHVASIGQQADSEVTVGSAAGKVGFFAHAAVTKPAVSGALSTVADAPAKAVLTSIILALSTLGLVTDSTT